jgi:hypothetical protein
MLLLKCLSGLSLTREFDSTQHSTQFDSMTGPIELNSRSARRCQGLCSVVAIVANPTVAHCKKTVQCVKRFKCK